jgi:hypothetical protein
VKSLAGISALSVMIGSDTGFRPVQPYLTEAQLRTDVELRIRKAGIAVVASGGGPDHATLYVDVSAIRSTTGPSYCVFDLSVMIQQTATVDRNNHKVDATTWGPKGYLGLDPLIEGAAETIRKQVGDFVDQFLNDYLTANPLKREAERQIPPMKEAGVSDNVIAAIVNNSSSSAGQISPEAEISTPNQLAQPLPSAVPDVPTAGKPRKLIVLAVSHSTSERDFTVATPRTTNTNCDLYPNSVNCRSTSYGGGSQNKAVYFFREVVTANEGGKVTQYTLSRTARWVWNSTDWLKDGESFPAEIKGKNMSITARRGGNQGKKEILKYGIVDIRPIP